MILFNTIPVPHFEARKILAGKPVVTREVYDQLTEEIRADSFTITGVEDYDTLQAVKDRIADLPEGAVWDDVKKDIARELSPWFTDEAALRRAQVLMRHHAMSAYASAQARVMDELIDVFPYRQYITSHKNVRASHAALDGIILAANHPFWEKHTPPWEWNCHCDVVELTAEDMEEEKGKDKDRPAYSQRVLEGAALKQLDQGQINRGPTININIQTPKEKGGNYENDVRKHGIDYTQIRHRWDKDVRGKFEKWADGVQVFDGSLLDTLLGRKPRKPSEPRKKPATKVTPAIPPKAQPKTKTSKEMIEKLAPLATEIEANTAEKAELYKLGLPILEDLKKGATPEKLAELKEVRKKLAVTEEKRKLLIEASRLHVELPENERGKIKLTHKSVSKRKRKRTEPSAMMRVAEDGAAITERYTHKDLLPAVAVKGKAGRARYDPNSKTLFISSSSGASTAAHEITHGTELQNPAILKKSKAFLKARAGNESTVSLRKITGDNYDDDERTWKDDWVGKGGHAYTGKDYDGVATELLSMGIERLHKDPATFAKQDPEYFEFVISTLQQL